MSSSAIGIKRKKYKESLQFAKKLLLIAVAVQVLLFLPVSNGELKMKIFWGVGVLSALFLIPGHVIVYRTLNIDPGAFQNGRVRTGPILTLVLLLMCCFMFFVPVLNLIIVGWGLAKASAGISTLDKLQAEEKILSDRRSRLSGG